MLDLALSLDTELAQAVRIATSAGKLIKRLRLEGLGTHEKDDASIVTTADLASDDLITQELSRVFPADGVLSEESGHRAGTSGRTWVIDPLDGTSGFAKGLATYSVHVGLLIGHEPVLGVVVEPDAGRVYRAIKGVGAFLSTEAHSTMRQLRVTNRDTLGDMRLVASSRCPKEHLESLRTHMGTREVRVLSSVGCKVGQVVRREADIYYSVHALGYWDTCAPLVIHEAAGGVFTTTTGALLSYDCENGSFVHTEPVVATNAKVHGACLEAIANAESLSPSHESRPPSGI